MGWVDPGAEDAPVVVTTFEQAARAWHANRLASLDAGHASRLLTRLVRGVEARGALDVSRRLKQHVSQIYRFAIPQGWADRDPAEYLSDLLKPKPRTRHMARVGIDELPLLVCAIDRYDGDETSKRRAVIKAALPFTLLTWARTNETRLATWAEFEGLDGIDPVWRVPADRMKIAREHIVPLSTPAVALLQCLRAHSRNGFAFAGDKLG